jgi:hypothetical protein
MHITISSKNVWIYFKYSVFEIPSNYLVLSICKFNPRILNFEKFVANNSPV